METVEKIKDLLKSLSKTRPIFHSKADFQHELAILLRDTYSPKRIRIKNPIIIENKNMHIDIYIETIDNRRIAIELKYRASEFVIDVDNETFFLKTHRLSDLAQFLFIEDISKIEKMIEKDLIDIGYAILLTNETAIYSNKLLRPHSFNLIEGHFIKGYFGLLYTKNNTKGQINTQYSKKFKEINLVGKYKIRFNEYSEYLKSLVLKVEKI